MESEWKNFKWVLTDCVIVGAHVDKHTFFVGQLLRVRMTGPVDMKAVQSVIQTGK